MTDAIAPADAHLDTVEHAEATPDLAQPWAEEPNAKSPQCSLIFENPLN